MEPLHRTTSPHSYHKPSPNTLAQSLPLTTAGQIAPSQIIYTETIGQDGNTTYRLFIAACISINGLMSGTQWIPIPAQIFPTNAIPTNAESQHDSERDHDRGNDGRMSFVISVPVHEDQFRAGSETVSSYGTARTHPTTSPFSSYEMSSYGTAGTHPSASTVSSCEMSSYSTAGTHPTVSTVSPPRVREHWRPGQRTVSYDQSGGAPPSQWSVSHHGCSQLPSQRLVSPYHRGQHPPGTHGGPYTIAAAVSNHPHCPYHTTTTIQLQTATRDPYNRGPSPSPYTGTVYQPPPQPQDEQGILPPPEGFSRPPNAAQSYTQFYTAKIQEMDDLMESQPRMPAVLMTHDVHHQDWIRFIQDLTDVWLGRLPLPSQGGRRPKRSTAAIDLVEIWNEWFFHARRTELIIYKGRERKNGKHAGRVDMNLPGFDLTAEDSSSDSTRREPQAIEAIGSKMRTKATKRGLEEVERKRRAQDLRTYALYLTCLPEAQM